MSSLSTDNRLNSGFAEKIKVVGAIVGILSAVALATFIGFKPEKKKLLEWEYVSKSSLVNQSAPAADKIQVFYENRQIKQLTVITAKLSNVGSVPVEGSDEVFPKVTFVEKVISADAKEPNRRGIKAEARFDEHSVEVRHGLLNPGDSIPVQILIEGDPGEPGSLPPVMYRIAGIEEPLTRYPSPTQTRVGVAYFHFARPVEYTILIVTSFIPLLVVGLALAAYFEALDSFFPERKLRKIRKQATLIAFQGGDTVGEKLGKILYRELPNPLDKKAQDLAKNIEPNPDESLNDYVNRAIDLIEPQVKPKLISQRFKALDKSAAISAIVILGVAVASALVLLGSWHRIITNY